MGKEIVWQGSTERRAQMYRPCDCGCDARNGKNGAGYLLGSDKEGNGVTVWIESEEVYQRLLRIIG